MNTHPTPQFEPAPPGAAPSRAGRLRTVIIAALAMAILVSAAWIASRLVMDRARERVEELLTRYSGEPVAVERISVQWPARVTLHDVEAGPFRADELRLDLSLYDLLRRDPSEAVRKVSIEGGEISLTTGQTGRDGAPALTRINVEGSASLQPAESGFAVEVTGGILAFAENRWTVEGKALLLPQGLESLEAALVSENGTDGRLHVVGARADGAGRFEIRVQGRGLSLPGLWGAFSSLLPGMQVPALPPPGEGVAGLDVKLVVAAQGIESAQGGAWVDGLVWHTVASDRAEFWGELRGEAAGLAPGHGFELAGRLTLGPGRIFHYEFSSLTGEVTGSRAGWRADPLTILSGAIGGVSGSVRVDLEQGGPTLRGHVDLGGAWLGGTRLSHGTIEFVMDQRGVTVSGEIGAGGGRAFTRGITVAQQGVSGEILVQGIALPALEQLVADAGFTLAVDRWRGSVSGSVALGGSAAEPLVRFALTGERAGAAGMAFDRVDVLGAWHRGVWEIDAATARGPGETLLEARGMAAPGGVVDLELEWRQFPVARLGRLIGPPAAEGVLEALDAQSSGRARLVGAGAGLYLTGEAEAEGTVGRHALKAGVALSGRPGGEIAVDGTVVSGDGHATFASIWTPGDKSVSVSLDAFPLGALAGLVGWNGVEGDGSGVVDLELPGDEAARGSADVQVPRLRLGGAEIAGARLQISLTDGGEASSPGGLWCRLCLYGEGSVTGKIEPGPGRRASDVALVAAFDGDEVTVTPVSVSLWGGRLALAGGARLVDGVWQLDLSSEGKDLRYEESGALARVDYQAALAGPVDALKLTARVAIKEGRVDLFRLPRVTPQAPAPGSRPANRLALDLDVHFEVGALRVMARSLLDGEVAGNVRLVGSRGELHASGDLDVARGYFGYLGRRFEVERGRLSFAGAGLIPRLEVTGAARLRDMTLYVDATGPADDLALSVRSDPPSDPGALRELLMEPLGGAEGVQGDWGVLASILATAFNQQVVSEVYWSVGRALEEALDIDLVELGPGQRQELELRLGKYVTPELYLAYRRSLAASGAEAVSLEYSLGRRLLLRTIWDREGGALLDAGVSFPF